MPGKEDGTPFCTDTRDRKSSCTWGSGGEDGSGDFSPRRQNQSCQPTPQRRQGICSCPLPPVCGLVILMAASWEAVRYQGLGRELAITLALPVPLVVDIPLCPPPADHDCCGPREFREPWSCYLPIIFGCNGFSRFGHQVGASAQDLRIGNRFLLRGCRSLERVPPCS